MDELQFMESENLDSACDNTHYGPEAGRYIADFIWERLVGLEN